MTEELLKKLHTAMCNDNEHQCNRLNNYIHTDEYLTAEVVQVVREIVAEETKEQQEENKELNIKIDRLESACNAYNYSQRTYQEEIKELKNKLEKLIDFVVSRIECCDVCPITDTCINSEGICPYAGILDKGEEVIREWLMQKIVKEIKENE